MILLIYGVVWVNSFVVCHFIGSSTYKKHFQHAAVILTVEVKKKILEAVNVSKGNNNRRNFDQFFYTELLLLADQGLF